MPILDTLCRALLSVIDAHDEIVVLHSALHAFGLKGEELKWPLLRTLRRLEARGQTLVLPTFTLSFLGGKAYHHRDSRSETGILGDWFLSLDGVKRLPHPVYSFAVAGPRAEEVLACAGETTFGPGSPFALFEERDARIVMLGCSWEYCTQFHLCEEEAGVPYRYFKDFRGRTDFGKGETEAAVRMYVRDLEIDPANALSPLVEHLARRRQGETGRGRQRPDRVPALPGADRRSPKSSARGPLRLW